MINPASLKVSILNILADIKAQSITEVNLDGLTPMADSMLICTATSTRHAKSIATKLLKALKSARIKPLREEGLGDGEWILVDCGDIVVHIMLATAREFYALEKLWCAITDDASVAA